MYPLKNDLGAFAYIWSIFSIEHTYNSSTS